MTGEPDSPPFLTDVVAADGTLLARAGDRPTPGLLEDVERRGRRVEARGIDLAETEVVSDLAAVVREPLYEVVFEQNPARSWLRLLEGLTLPASLLEEFRQLRTLDGYTYRHVLMTTVLTGRMLQDLGWNPDDVRAGAFAALTHDFGKLRVPVAVLLKHDPLAGTEARAIREHPLVGGLLLRYYLGSEGPNVRVALEHHERPDGSGYPARIRLSDRLVRVVAVNDIFDALVSPRPYRSRPFDVRGALELLWAEVKAGHADEEACRLLISYNRQNKPDPWRLRVSEEVRARPPEESSYGTILEE